MEDEVQRELELELELVIAAAKHAFVCDREGHFRDVRKNPPTSAARLAAASGSSSPESSNSFLRESERAAAEDAQGVMGLSDGEAGALAARSDENWDPAARTLASR